MPKEICRHEDYSCQWISKTKFRKNTRNKSRACHHLFHVKQQTLCGICFYIKCGFFTNNLGETALCDRWECHINAHWKLWKG